MRARYPSEPSLRPLEAWKGVELGKRLSRPKIRGLSRRQMLSEKVAAGTP